MENVRDKQITDTDLLLANIDRIIPEDLETKQQEKKEKVLRDLTLIDNLNEYMDILARIPLNSLQAKDLELIKGDLSDILDNDIWSMAKSDIYFLLFFIACNIAMVVIPSIREYFIIKFLYFLNLGFGVSTIRKNLKEFLECNSVSKRHKMMVDNFWEIVENEKIKEMGITKEIKWSVNESMVIKKEIEFLTSEIKQDMLLLDFKKRNLYESKLREIEGYQDREKKTCLQNLKIEIEFELLKENKTDLDNRLYMFLSNFTEINLTSLYQVYGYYSSLLQDEGEAQKQIVLNSFASYFWFVVQNMTECEREEVIRIIMFDVRFLKKVCDYGLDLVGILKSQVLTQDYGEILRMIMREFDGRIR